MHQFGTGRPDQQDEKELIRFSEQIMQKIETKMECMKVELPGNHNYREYNGVPLKPVVNANVLPVEFVQKNVQQERFQKMIQE